jgi:Uma2 family endonuclease
MSIVQATKPPAAIIYPESDGKPMADNTRQLNWIIMLADNLRAIFHERDDVFVSGNQFWYPVEYHPEIVIAPDVYVVFGRPKGDRPSYKQWEEDNIPMTVVFEVLSPGNTLPEMIDKHAFYEEYGVEEYYIHDPDHNRLFIYMRQGTVLKHVHDVATFVSPRLGIRFDDTGDELVVYRPDGRAFISFEELQMQAEQAEARAEQARQQVEDVQRRSARLAELSRKARRGQASVEELQELDRLENDAPATS